MGFAVEWAPRAEDDLDRLPLGLLQIVIDEVYKLADNPVRLSRPPRRGAGMYQRYQADVSIGPGRTRITILFQYTQDEMAIEIMGVSTEAL
jgi:hypothetical protein